MEWSKPAIWGRAGEDASNLEIVKKWLVEYVESEHSQ